MSLLDTKISVSKGVIDNAILSSYHPSDEEKEMNLLIRRHFALGDITMQKPRVEFNDLSVLNRTMVDQMSFNTYQPNNGDALSADILNSWRSRAMKPIVRNKIISVAAHATARLIFPKVFAHNSDNDEQADAARVMSDLIEWSCDNANGGSGYGFHALARTITALTDPVSIGYHEYAEIYCQYKTEKDENGNWKWDWRLDEELSGFQDEVVPADQLYIENFYEPDIQRQAWLLRRKVMSYDLAQRKYQKKYPNFKFVQPGVQLVYNEANTSFYAVYDTNMRQYDVEEVTYWNKSLDVRLTMVNGVLLTDYDEPNPRQDKLYPFDKFGYEMINNRCFYYKSLAFKTTPEANIVNTLYPMIIDGTYLNLMPPMINRGSEMIGSDVIVPGAVTTLSSPDAKLEAIGIGQNLKAGMDTLFKVEESISQSSESGLQQGTNLPPGTTAYEISREEQNANTVLGLFIKMIGDHVRQFGKLRLGDILQYQTIADVMEQEGDSELVYKTFLLHEKNSGGKTKTKKIKFDLNLPSKPISEKENLDLSYETMKMQGGKDSNTELSRVNPDLFRKLKFMTTITADVLNPMSEDLERSFMLEEYDRMIMNPIADQEEAFKMLLSAYPKTRKDPEKYISKQQPGQNPQNPMMGIGQSATGASLPKTMSPLGALAQAKGGGKNLTNAPMTSSVLGK